MGRGLFGCRVRSLGSAGVAAGFEQPVRFRYDRNRQLCSERRFAGDLAVGDEVGVSWRQSAACLGGDPELFFPVGTSGPAVLQVEAAKAVCRGCPVAAPCLTWALDAGVEHGVWGGLTEEERRALRRRRSRVRISRSG
jgi:WhiB family transcriptional regulator, redox-sensing transcriptional regulator